MRWEIFPMFGKPTIGNNQQRWDSVALGFEPAIADLFDASRNPQSRERPLCEPPARFKSGRRNTDLCKVVAKTRKATLPRRLRRHRDELAARGLAPEPEPRDVPAWWREPMFCGWGSQCYLARTTGTHAPAHAKKAKKP